MEGGIDSGFSRVAPTEYQPRLLHVKGKGKAVRVQEVPLTRDSLNEGDVFILDNGLSLFQWNGSHSSVFEKRKGSETITHIREDRHGRKWQNSVAHGTDNANRLIIAFRPYTPCVGWRRVVSGVLGPPRRHGTNQERR